jgi:hypothetical protein
MFIFDTFFLHAFNLVFAIEYESFESRKDLRARITETFLVFFFSFPNRAQ